MAEPKFEIYADAAGKYRWRLLDGNSEKVASSNESFDSRSNAKRAAQNVKDTAPNADIEDWLQEQGRTRRSHLSAPRAQLYDKGGTMPRNERHGVPNPDGGWDVRAPGAQRSSGHADTQSEAIDRAREIVHNSGGGEVIIHGRDGRIRDSDTIAPGNDPNPPRDTR